MIKLFILGLGVLLAFGSVVLSAMSSSEAQKADVEKAKKYAIISAVLSALVIVCIVGAILVGMYYEHM